MGCYSINALINIDATTKEPPAVVLSLTRRVNYGPVHTYPDIFESANFSFPIRLPSTLSGESGKKINPLSRVEKNKSPTNPITCGRVNPDIFESDDVKSVSTLSPNNKPIWRHNVEGERTEQISRHYLALRRML